MGGIGEDKGGVKWRLERDCLQGINVEFPTCERKKIEKTHTKENNHSHKTIFMWFGNLPTSTELQEFHYYQGGKYKMRLQFFTLSEDDNNNHKKNPNHQKTVFTSYAQESQQATKRAKNLREFELEKKKREKIKKEVRKKVIDTEMSRGERRENIEEEREINIFLRKEEKEYKIKVTVNIKYGN